ncbi:hypothetical protein HLV37_01005 [Eggerthellaceae bacterium zg-1084]|uniref:Uncharacterized protein n=1 Tax=Berryella wangjianweii TaxID=2734634 RepID=A0A6M8J6W1_9ACTN|nr:hypothetical protein [Berryella wangjianweii]NPD30463.1 hypothetical protein [Berryella wangjianweii]NPD32766.1 hypothetical protein [Eggerthellaceae bacterium zg-997]QKF07129.1 hypothetical protein HLV38_02575 [Berryella wangjianweii]
MASRRNDAAGPEESQRYRASYRAVCAEGAVKVYNGAGMRRVERAMSFDVMDERFSAVDEFVAGLLSEVLLVIGREFAREGEELMDVEGRAHVTVGNPLAALGVCGIEGVPVIEAVQVDVYLFTFLPEDEARAVIDRALGRAVLYQSLREPLGIRCRFTFAQ